MQHDELTKTAISATLHCLTGCAIGEVIGTVVGSGLNWSNMATSMLAFVLAFIFGYSLTMRSLLRHKLGLKKSAKVAVGSDTFSILTMEIVDTIIILTIPGALAAGPTTLLFWASLSVALLVAFVCAVPVNRYLISRGKGHAIIHQYHEH